MNMMDLLVNDGCGMCMSTDTLCSGVSRLAATSLIICVCMVLGHLGSCYITFASIASLDLCMPQ